MTEVILEMSGVCKTKEMVHERYTHLVKICSMRVQIINCGTILKAY